MSGMIVRPAEPQDMAAITRIYAQAVLHGTATFEIDPPDQAEMTARYSALTSGGFPYLVAEIAGAVQGYAYAGLFRTRPAYRFTLEDSIYVAPDAQRRGVGNALLVRLLAETTALGYRQMIAVIGDSANRGSIGLHERHGFAMIGTMPATGFKFGRWIDTVLMQRALGPGASTLP